MNDLLHYAVYGSDRVSTDCVHYPISTDCKCRNSYPQNAFLQVMTDNGKVMFDMFERVIQRFVSGGLKGSNSFICMSGLPAVQLSTSLLESMLLKASLHRVVSGDLSAISSWFQALTTPAVRADTITP